MWKLITAEPTLQPYLLQRSSRPCSYRQPEHSEADRHRHPESTWQLRESNHWYGSNGLGIQLRVPVFDGFEKRSKIRKAKIEEENARIGYEDALKGLQANYMNAVSEVNNSQRNYKKQFDNYTMAQDVYNVTADQYKEGVASMTAVLQDEMRMSEAMNNYLTAYYRYKVANLSLLKLTGQLNQISVAK